MARTAERQEFLADVITTAVEGGINYWAQVLEYRWYTPTLDGGSAEPGPNGTANAYVTLTDLEDPDEQYDITVDSIARALSMIRASLKGGGRPKGWNRTDAMRVLAASSANDAGDIDSADADCVLQYAIFDEVVYG